jgi:hypothetical protein
LSTYETSSKHREKHLANILLTNSKHIVNKEQAYSEQTVKTRRKIEKIMSILNREHTASIPGHIRRGTCSYNIANL